MAASDAPPSLPHAVQLHREGRLSEAEKTYREILARDPDCIDALHLLGVVALQTGRYAMALESIGQAAARAPDNGTIQTNLGEAFRRSNLLQEAIAAFHRALKLQPDLPATLNNLGGALIALNRQAEAIPHLRRAVALDPAYANAHNSLGLALLHQESYEEAASCFRRALALRPDFAEAHNNLGCLFKDTGRLDEALDQFRSAIALEPNYAAANSNLLFALPFHPGYDAAAIAAAHHQWAARHAAAVASRGPPHANDRDPDRRLRLGYVSPDFRDHVVGRNLLPLFRHHRHEDFEIFCYSDPAAPDRITGQFRAGADVWRNISGLSDNQVAGLVRSDRIDVLVDLTLHMAGSRLLMFARKPAPVQVTFAAYPGTTGVAAIDYRLTDPYLDPPGRFDADYAEASFRLPHSFWCYAPLGDEPPVGALPAATNGFITFGNLNSFCKVNPPVLRLWARVLHAVDRSRLLLLAADGGPRRQVLEIIASEGIDPDRIRFAERRPRVRYLELYHEIDLGLDTFPYNGHTTSLDSYWMGVPVVSLIGRTVVGRAGWSQLSNLGLAELAARTEEEFVQVGASLARDVPRLETLRRSLRSLMERSPLMDAPGFTHAIEAAYRTMWRRWCAQAIPGPV